MWAHTENSKQADEKAKFLNAYAAVSRSISEYLACYAVSAEW
jgi:hypothetical protein